MRQKQIKANRKIVEKAAKAHALELAKAQIMDIANASFKIRWRFCRAILFPKKLKLDNQEDVNRFKIQSYGGFIPGRVINNGFTGGQNAGSK